MIAPSSDLVTPLSLRRVAHAEGDEHDGLQGRFRVLTLTRIAAHLVRASRYISGLWLRDDRNVVPTVTVQIVYVTATGKIIYGVTTAPRARAVLDAVTGQTRAGRCCERDRELTRTSARTCDHVDRCIDLARIGVRR